MAVQVCDSTGAKLRGLCTESSDAARAWVRYRLERLQTAEALGEAPPRTLRKPGDDFWLQVIYAARVGRLLITQSRSHAAGTVLHLVDASVAAVLSLCSEMRWATRNGAASSLGRAILVSIESLNLHWSTPSASPGSRSHRYQNQAK